MGKMGKKTLMNKLVIEKFGIIDKLDYDKIYF